MIGFEHRGKALGRFIEECGEVLAAAGKTVRFGWNSYNPFDPHESNEEWLYREILDLEKAIKRLRRSRKWD